MIPKEISLCQARHFTALPSELHDATRPAGFTQRSPGGGWMNMGFHPGELTVFHGNTFILYIDIS